MLSLAGYEGLVKGVDSLAEEAFEPPDRIALEYNVVAMATGRVDWVSDGRRLVGVEGGSELFKYTTGTGCMLDSVVASFMAVNRDYLKASIEASLVFKRAGEIAEIKAGRNPATFRIELINALHNIDRFIEVKDRVKVVRL